MQLKHLLTLSLSFNFPFRNSLFSNCVSHIKEHRFSKKRLHVTSAVTFISHLQGFKRKIFKRLLWENLYLHPILRKPMRECRGDVLACLPFDKLGEDLCVVRHVNASQQDSSGNSIYSQDLTSKRRFTKYLVNIKPMTPII